MSRVAGFSLIELAVTFAVMALLLAAGLPFARAWNDGNRLVQARNLVWEGVSQARAVALRNPGAVAAGNASAWLRRNGNKLEVQDAGGTVLWASAALPEGTSTMLPGANAAVPCDLSGVAFDNRGRIVERIAIDPACVPDNAGSRLAVGFGDQSLPYVDLL